MLASDPRRTVVTAQQRRVHLTLVVLLLLGLCAVNYIQIIGLPSTGPLLSKFLALPLAGYLLAVAYAGLVLGLSGGLVALGVAAVVPLSLVLAAKLGDLGYAPLGGPDWFSNILFAVASVLAVGGFVLYVLHRLAVEQSRRTVELAELDAARRQLEAEVLRQQHAMQALSASEQRFRSLTQSASDAIISGDGAGIIVAWNRGARDMFGYEENEMLGQPLTQLMPERYRQAHLAGLERLRSTGVTHVIGRTVELHGLRKNGAEFPLELSLFAWAMDGQRFFGGIIRDLTERHALEENLRQALKMEAIGRLAGGIAHDFNNLLTPILGYAELGLRAAPPEGRVRDGYQRIAEAAQRARGLTQQLLAFSRRQVLHSQLMDLNDLVSTTLGLVGRTLGEDVRVTKALSPNPVTIRADPGQMGQVLLNLLVNARDAMPNGGTIAIQTALLNLAAPMPNRSGELPPGAYASLAVSDTGPGISAEIQKYLFEPFFTTKQSGTGLGLATSYGIVSQSGGHILVESEPGHGATFRILVPQAVGEIATERTAPPLPAAGSMSGTILLVEDDSAVRSVAAAVLRENGYTVLEAQHGEEALRIAVGVQGRIDLLLTDVVMPEMNGPELARRIESYGSSRFKLLYMSGYSREVVAHHGVPLPQTELLEKPFTPAALLARVHATLNS